jgi:hypothetical protein
MFWKNFLGVLLLATIALAEKARYDNYRVHTIHIGNELQLEALRHIENNPDGVSI